MQDFKDEDLDFLVQTVEFLRLIPEFKRKPALLRTGRIEQAERLARYVFHLYSKLKGMPLNDAIEQFDSLTTPEPDFHEEKPDYSPLNAWHLELSILADFITHLLGLFDDEGDSWKSAGGHLAIDKLTRLLDSFPMPK
jgi:hypothetical protein